MNISIFVIVLTLSSIDSFYDLPPRYILSSLTLLFYFICLFVDGLMFTRVIMRDNSWYLLVNQLIVVISIT